ncbi:MAG: NUDIX domain-containing protein [Patescibacteria group bacterium]|nr:NUDIX domain-containing protein [Patescibacteria group bacterium]MCL5262004.1 NUDIX domain-containing protein [Patescibacteria group bacterium]
MNKETVAENGFYAGGFFYNPTAKSVLLHKRDSSAETNPDKWAFFGGSAEGGETPCQTFKREIREELGVDLKGKDIVPLADYFNEDLRKYRCVFFVETELPKSSMRLGEGADFDWIPLKRVFGYDLTDKTAEDLRFFIAKHVR